LQETSVKAVTDEANTACRDLHEEIADRLPEQEHALCDISASDDRQANKCFEIRHQCDALHDQLDALRSETPMDKDRLRGQIMELNSILENKERERSFGDTNLHQVLFN